MNSATNRKFGAMLSIVNMVASVAIGLVYTPFVLRFLGQSEYGIFSLANSLIAYLSVLDLGFGNALVRYTARAREEGKDEKNIYGMFLLFYSIISAVATLAGIFIYSQIGSFFSTSFSGSEIVTLQKIYIILLINTIIAFPASVFSSIIRSHEKFVFANSVILVQNVLRHVLNLVVLYFGYKSLALAVLSLVFTIIVAIANVIYCFKKLNVKIGFKKFEKSFYKEIFVYSFYILLNIIVDQLYASTDNIILGKFCGSTVVAVYGIGIVFETYFMQFSTSIASVFLPHISRLSVHADGKKEISNIFVKVGRIQFILLSMVLIGYIVFGQEFIDLWAGKGYEDAYYIALVIMIPNLIPLSQNIGISVLQAHNKHGVRSVMYLLIAILNVIITIPLSIKLGGFGAALGTAIGNVLGQILFMNWFYGTRIGLDIPKYWREIIKISVSSLPVALVFYVINRFIPLYGWLGLILKGGLSVALSIPYCYFVILNTEEKELVKGFFKIR